MAKIHLSIQGMSCGNCVRHATEALQGVEGVRQVTVDLASASGTVEFEGADVSSLLKALEDEGYPSSVRES